jgi:DNA-binding response OmpR family regulator
MRLLLVEDEHAIRTAISRALKRWGHEVAVAASLAEARECFGNAGPEAVISDLKLPDGSGLDFCTDCGLPFLLMSGYANFEDAVVALRHGCVDFLTKPVALPALRQSVDRLVGERPAELTVLAADDSGSDSDKDGGNGGLQLVQPGSDGCKREALQVRDFRWADRAEARQLFDNFTAEGGDLRQRRVLAELMQCSDEGRLVLNRSAAWWRAWVPVSADWDAPERADRRRILEELVDRIALRADGILVECRDAA